MNNKDRRIRKESFEKLYSFYENHINTFAASLKGNVKKNDFISNSEIPELKAKVLITTNLDQEDSSRTEIESMADGYLIKAELTPHQLVQITSDILDGKKPSESYLE